MEQVLTSFLHKKGQMIAHWVSIKLPEPKQACASCQAGDCLFLSMQKADDAGSWITINGTHVHLNDAGEVDKGPVSIKHDAHHAVNGHYVDPQGVGFKVGTDKYQSTKVSVGYITDKHGTSYLVTHSVRGNENGEIKHQFKIHEPGTEIKEAWNGQNTIGHADVSFGKNRIMSVGVENDYQRKGLASALYDHIENKIGTTLRPNEAQTEDGQALWASRASRKVNA